MTTTGQEIPETNEVTLHGNVFPDASFINYEAGRAKFIQDGPETGNIEGFRGSTASKIFSGDLSGAISVKISKNPENNLAQEAQPTPDSLA